MELKTVEERTIFSAIMGSHHYGLNTESSDIDEFGVCIPTLDYFLGMKRFEQSDKFKDEFGNKIDKTIYSLDKAIKLISENNPNMLSFLFVDEKYIKICKPEWKRFLDIKNEFLSKEIRWSFSGFSHAQMKRLMNHKSFYEKPVPKPIRKEYDLPEKSIFPETQVEAIAKLSDMFIEEESQEDFHKQMTHVNEYYAFRVLKEFISDPVKLDIAMERYKQGQTEFLRTLEHVSQSYIKEEFQNAAKNELRYLTAWKNWKIYNDWEKGRNPKRQSLEKKCGYDSKHACMVILMLKLAIEVLETHNLRLDRTNIDREELLALKMGNVKFEDFESQSNKLKADLELAYEKSTLRTRPNINLIQTVKMEILEEYLFPIGGEEGWKE
jgi:uncharacterized protein